MSKIYYLTQEEFDECKLKYYNYGVYCVWIEEAEDWVAIQEHCGNCGCLEDECECDEPNIIPANAYVKIIRISS
ncbi:MAG: hypothetical protein WCI60_04730 [bacterium]